VAGPFGREPAVYPVRGEILGSHRETPTHSPDRASSAFRICFALLSEYRRCLYADPELPRELLRPDWSGVAARELFTEMNATLIRPALAHVDTVCALSESTHSLQKPPRERAGSEQRSRRPA
jgi:DNA-binding transcriptional regulator PaaX